MTDMELFAVKRYTDVGEEPIEPVLEDQDKLLKKLLKKAKKRKHEENDTNLSKIELKKDDSNVVDEQVVSTSEAVPLNENIESQNLLENQNNDNKTFQVLGDDVFKKKPKVEMVLPSWLTYATVISKQISEENEALENLKYLSPRLLENLKKMGFVKLFPVQKEVIPSILNSHSKPFPFKPRDICVSAPTGSGKTLAFAIPLIQLLMNRVECKIRALIILPVNELALQVFQVLKSLAKGTVLSIGLLSKKFPFAVEQQKLVDFHQGKYYSNFDIIVTTPGRLVEHLHSTKGFCLKNLKFLIIDEADRIMEQVHFNWLYHLDEHVRKTSDKFFSDSLPPLCLRELNGSLANQPHKMLFSATLSHDPEKLINVKLFQPKLFTTVIMPIEELNQKLHENINANNIKQINDTKETRGEFIGKYTTPLELTEKLCLAEVATKPLTLFALIKQNNWNKFLCFTNSIDSAYRLARVLDFFFLRHNLIFELSASLTAKRRAEILDNFTQGRIKGLVCSDTLARGIDIPEVDVVILYDVPRHINTYIHRVGRTARAGRPGTAITLLSKDEINNFKFTLSKAGKKIPEEIKVDGRFEEEHANQYTGALHYLQTELQKTKNMEIIRSNTLKHRATRTNEDNASITALEKIQNQLNINMESKFSETLDQKIPRKYRKKMKTDKINKNEIE